MKIVLATGVYPPDLGGPATYTNHLFEEFSAMGHDVRVVTYGDYDVTSDDHRVCVVLKTGNVFARWWRYAKALRVTTRDADCVLALSSVSVGVPLVLARLKKPKKFLRLGGDFFWERYTDAGGMLSLRAWHRSTQSFLWRIILRFIFSQFDEIVYSTRFQEEIHETAYASLPPHCVLENGVSFLHNSSSFPRSFEKKRLLFLGRFVGFKNLFVLLQALTQLPDYSLTLAGDGPLRRRIEQEIHRLSLSDRVRMLPPVHGEAKRHLFDTHDLLVLPSITEISPNTALEATSAGLPVLLTSETGFVPPLTNGMMLMPLSLPEEIVKGVWKAEECYDVLAKYCSVHHSRSWRTVAEEWVQLFYPHPDLRQDFGGQADPLPSTCVRTSVDKEGRGRIFSI
jgi:glycosyltransferase involved in cell wall biosynthesis